MTSRDLLRFNRITVYGIEVMWMDRICNPPTPPPSSHPSHPSQPALQNHRIENFYFSIQKYEDRVRGVNAKLVNMEERSQIKVKNFYVIQ